jgi:hypothetical protein
MSDVVQSAPSERYPRHLAADDSVKAEAISRDDLFAIVDACLVPTSAAEEEFVLSLFAATKA